jgi:hypothetical protein
MVDVSSAVGCVGRRGVGVEDERCEKGDTRQTSTPCGEALYDM